MLIPKVMRGALMDYFEEKQLTERVWGSCGRKLWMRMSRVKMEESIMSYLSQSETDTSPNDCE